MIRILIHIFLVFFVFSIIFYLFAFRNRNSSYIDKRERSIFFQEGSFIHPEWPKKGLIDVIKMRFSGAWSSWPDKIESELFPRPKDYAKGGEVFLTHIGHASFLIQIDGVNILTDPIYSDRCSPVSFAGPKRVRQPGIRFKDLPPIHMVLISHDHYDHLDYSTLESLVKRDNPLIYIGLGVARHLPQEARFKEMDWWESHFFLDNFKIHFTPTKHFSGRTLFDRFSTLWGAFVINTREYKIYFGGDSAYGIHYSEVFKRFGSMDLSLLPIGAYSPRDFMKYAHMNPEEAVKAHLDLDSRLSIGMHYGTFQLTAEPIGEPIEKLEEELISKNLSSKRFRVLKFGKVLKLKKGTE